MAKDKMDEKCVDSFAKGLFSFTNLVAEDNQIQFVYKIVCAMENHVKEEKIRQLAIKKVLLHFLKVLQFDSDEELELILVLWKKFAKTSQKLGPVEVFKNLEENYSPFWQYYRLFIEALMENNKRKDIPAVLERCCKNCEISMDELKVKFGPKFASVFPAMNEEEDTMALLQHQPQRKSIISDRQARVQRRRSSLAPPKLDMVFEKSGEGEVLGAGEPQVMKKKDHTYNDFQDTMTPFGSQNPPSQPPPVSQSPPPKNSDDFSVYCDATTQRVTSVPEPEKNSADDFSIYCDPPVTTERQKVPHYLSPGNKTPAVSSPLHKKTRPSVSPPLDESIPIEININKENHKKRSLDINSPTVCGFGRQNGLNMVTSTPDGKKNPFNLGISKVLDFDRQSPLNLSEQLEGVDGKPLINISNKQAKTTTPEPFEKVMDRLSIAAPHCESPMDSTVNVSLDFDGKVNPWDEKARMDMVKRGQLVVNQHDFTTQKAPKFDINNKVFMGGEAFFIYQLLGQGGFAKVFRAVTDDNKTFAIKYQKPPCPYEVQMINAVNKSMPEHLKSFVMDIRDAFIFSDASAIVSDFHKYGSALDLSNTYRKNNREMHGAALTLISIQLAEVLRYIHKAEIIHADIKPDNILMCEPFSAELSPTQMLDKPLIKLIDFGRAIDMKYYKGMEFRGRAKTKSFECCEMLDGRPWTYQADFFGFVASIFLLMNNQYMEVKKEGSKYKPTVQIKRRLVNRHVFTEIFDEFLNIPNCKQQPSWEKVIKFMTEQLVESQKQDLITFRNGIQALSDMIKHSKAA